jgi:hypothetical protein
MMIKLKNISFYIFFCVLSACGQDSDNYNNLDMKITDYYEDYKYINNSRSGYYLQVNNQNCYYDIRVNDGPTGLYFDEFPAYSVRLPINLNILKSGEQKLSIKIFPFQGDTLSAKANLQLRLMRYSDMTDMENDFGGSTVLWEWNMPNVGSQKLPIFAFDTVFEADVPYNLEIFDLYATDLSEMDKKDLLAQVVNEFTNKRDSIINRSQDRDYLLRHVKRALVQIYPDDQLLNETVDGMLILGEGKIPQPLEDFELQLYYNNKLATLVRRKNKEATIWFENEEKTSISFQPYYIFKHKETGTWHMW